MAVEPLVVNARILARAWWSEKLDEGSDVHLPDTTRKMLSELRMNPDFMETFFEDFAYEAMYEFGKRVMAQTRMSMSPEEARERAFARIELDRASGQSVFAKWRERDPERKVYMLIRDMTKVQLASVIAGREKIATENWNIAQRYRNVMDKMPNDTSVVGDVFTEEQFIELFDEIEEK